MKDVMIIVGGLLAVIGFISAVVIIFTFPFWLLWNWLMPIFGLPTLTILQTFGMLVLLQIVFGNIFGNVKNDDGYKYKYRK